jgi:hypothetical protein
MDLVIKIHASGTSVPNHLPSISTFLHTLAVHQESSLDSSLGMSCKSTSYAQSKRTLTTRSKVHALTPCSGLQFEQDPASFFQGYGRSIAIHQLHSKATPVGWQSQGQSRMPSYLPPHALPLKQLALQRYPMPLVGSGASSSQAIGPPSAQKQKWVPNPNQTTHQCLQVYP